MFSWLRRVFGRKEGVSSSASPIFFSNTLSGKKDLFTPLKPGMVSMYSCGPTVYSRAHIGNMRPYVFSDTIDRVLEEAGYHVRRVINITDVGHLVGDGDHGEDKMEKGAREEQKTPTEIAAHYTNLFFEDIKKLNIDTNDILFPRATEYIKEQIAMIQTLEEKGFAYRAEDGMYFDTARFPTYGKLGGVDQGTLLPGARIEKIPGKRNVTDFVLWRDAKPNDLQQWDSPWGRGNPGWHIECSAMSKSLLGVEIDIHTGGIDHIPIHHNNEIAQSEGASGRPFVRYWIHNAFLNVEHEKISKSLGNDVYVPDVEKHGFHPLALRYFFLQAHYRNPLSFSWDALSGASEALKRIWRISAEIKKESQGETADSDARERFIAVMRDDLSTPQALGILWETLRDEEYSAAEKWALLVTADELLGLSLVVPPSLGETLSLPDLPAEVQKLVEERDLARGAGNFTRADELRTQLQNSGYRVDDSPSGTLLTKDVR